MPRSWADDQDDPVERAYEDAWYRALKVKSDQRPLGFDEEHPDEPEAPTPADD